MYQLKEKTDSIIASLIALERRHRWRDYHAAMTAAEAFERGAKIYVYQPGQILRVIEELHISEERLREDIALWRRWIGGKESSAKVLAAMQKNEMLSHWAEEELKRRRDEQITSEHEQQELEFRRKLFEKQAAKNAEDSRLRLEREKASLAATLDWQREEQARLDSHAKQVKEQVMA